MSILSTILSNFVNAVIAIFGLNRSGRIACAFAERLNPVARIRRGDQQYLVSCPNSLTRWRAETFFTKEPETIEWIDGFAEGDTLFDIGANIGLYSLYAAKRGITVVAFEPESQNYALLNKNMYLNKCDERVSCLNLALSDADALDSLYLPVFQAGGALNSFGTMRDWDGKEFKAVFRQGVVSFTLDSFLARHPGAFPTHIKIDVDGIEPRIIKGADRTLGDPRLRSLSVEINEALPDHLAIVNLLSGKKFTVRHKKHATFFDSSEFKNCYNYVFVR